MLFYRCMVNVDFALLFLMEDSYHLSFNISILSIIVILFKFITVILFLSSSESPLFDYYRDTQIQ